MTSAAENKAYTVKRLNVNSIADISRLDALVYQRKPAIEFFLKKYNTVYTGAKYIGFIAYNNQNQPIAFYGVIPTLLWYNGHTILAAQSADTMTHPEYRNMGLFTELANLTYDLCSEENIQLVFGFPNQNSLPGFINKLNWQVLETMDRFQIHVKKIIPFEKIVHKYPALKSLYNIYKARILKKHLKPAHGIANSVLADNYSGVFRDDKYFSYKSYSPAIVIQINSTLLWIKLDNGLQVGDMTVIGEDFAEVMKKLVKLARKLGVAQIHFHVSPQPTLHALFAQHYAANLSYPVIFKDLKGYIKTEKIKFTLADIDIF
jgi:GNAT superfamily N-acetyltransferase